MDRSDVCLEDRAKSRNFTKWILLANLRPGRVGFDVNLAGLELVVLEACCTVGECNSPLQQALD
jgi:hypothetical protein